MLHELEPARAHLLGDFRETIAGQVDETALVPSSKKLISCVLPGVRLTRASAVRSVMALMALDLPAFDRPAKAISRPVSGASWCGSAALVRNVTWG